MGVWAERSVFDLVIGCFGLARESVCPTGGGGWRRQTKATHAKRQRVARKTGALCPYPGPADRTRWRSPAAVSSAILV